MVARVLIGLFAVGVLATTLVAAPDIDVGTHYLDANLASQVVTLYVTGGDAVSAFNLRAQIGDGLGGTLEPIFQSVGFTGGSIWDAGPVTVTGGPLGGAPQLAQASVVFNTTMSVPANDDKWLVKLTIDTTGFFSGTYPLMLAGTQIGVDSDFVAIGGSTIVPTITNGTLIIPEPAALVVLALGWMGLAARRKR